MAAETSEAFAIVRRLSSGPVIDVFLARRSGQAYVLKRVSAAAARVEDFRQAFLDEARLAQVLVHPNIARIVETGDEDGGAWLAMAFVDGRSLREIAARGPIPLAIALRIVIDAARGLHHAHEREDDQGWPLGILHRDVCPSNLLVGFDGITRVSDFGLLRAASRLPQSAATLAEKLPYCSPEQLCGAPIDHRGDLFALAIVLYEITVRRPPFQGAKAQDLMRAIVECRPEPPTAVDPKFPLELERVLLRALERLPDERQETCRGFAKSLEDVLERIDLSATEADVGAWMRAAWAVDEALEPSEPELLLQEGTPVPPQLEVLENTPAQRAAPPIPPPPPAALASAQPLPNIPTWGEEVMEDARLSAVPPPLPAPASTALRDAAQAAAKAAAARAAAQKTAADKAAQGQIALAAARAETGEARQHAADATRDLEGLRAELAETVRWMEAATREAAEAQQDAAGARRDAALARATAESAAAELVSSREDTAKTRAQLDAARRDQEMLAVAADHASNEARVATARAVSAESEAGAARRALEEVSSRESESSRDMRTTALRLATARRERDGATEREKSALAEAAASKDAAESAQRALDEMEILLRDARREGERARDEAAADATQRAEAAAREAEQLANAASRDEELDSWRAAAQSEIRAAVARENAARRNAKESEARAAEARAQAEAAHLELETLSATAKHRAAALRDEADAARADLAREREEAAVRESEAAAREELAIKAAGMAKRDSLIAREESDRLRREAETARAAESAARAESHAAAKNAAEWRTAADASRARAEAAAREAAEGARAAETARAAAERATSETARAEASAKSARADEAVARADALLAREEAAAARADAAATRAKGAAATSAANEARVELAAAREDAAALRAELESARAAAIAATELVLPPRPEDTLPPAADDDPDPVRHVTGLIAYSQVELYLMSFSDAARSNITADPGLFVGRDETIREMDILARADEPVVTLVGADGSGRTRVARRYGSLRLVELSSAGGVWYADLSAARNADGICLAVASALSVPIDAAQNAASTVKSLGHALAARGRLLLILDEIDAVRPALAEILLKWMGTATEARFLVVARAAVGVPGERVCATGGLATGSASDGALRLFVERLRARKRESDLKEPGAREAIEGIVKRLGGHPLAVEIAASFTDRVTPATLGAELAAGEGTPLAIVLDACAKRLLPHELDALAQLSVFAGAMAVDTACEVLLLGSDPEATPSAAIRALRSRALLRTWEPPDLPGETRLVLHPAIRVWATARLAALGGAAGAEARHADAVARAAEVDAGAAEHDPRSARRLSLLVPDLVAAHERAAARPPDAASTTRALRALVAAGPALSLAGSATAGEWLEAALPAARGAGADRLVIARAEVARARLRREQGDAAATLEGLNQSLGVARELGDGALEMSVLAEQARALRSGKKLVEARAALDGALRLARRAKDERLEATLLGDLGALCEESGNLELAISCHEEAIELSARLGLTRLEGELLGRLGAILQDRGREESRSFLERALALHKEVRNRAFEAATVGRIAAASLEAGRHDEARSLYLRAIQIHAEMGDQRGEAGLRGALGVAEHLAGNLDEARAALVRAVWLLGDAGDSRREAFYLAHLGALEAARGKLPTAFASFDIARKRLTVENDLAGLGVVEILSGVLDLARARESGTLDAARATVAKLGDPLDPAPAARFARRLLARELER